MAIEAFLRPAILAILILPLVSAASWPAASWAGERSEDMAQVMDVVKDIEWLGHDTFRITGKATGDKVIYTDPFQLKGKLQAADVILITHDHRDHCSTDDIKKLQKPDTIIVAPPDCAEKLSGEVMAVSPGDSVEAGGIKVEAVPAYNTNKQFHTKNRNWVGYIFTLGGGGGGGVRIYLAGDTDYIPEMKGFKCDIALIPVSGTYVMTAEEAVRAALDIKPRVAIPMHYGSIVGSADDAEKFKDALKGKVEVVILERH